MNHISHFVHTLPDTAPKTARGQKTWGKILEAAEYEFGEKGFHEAAITGITQRAGVAMGTFYVHFKSKEEIFRTLIVHMGKLTRSWIGQRVAEAPSRLEAERMGLQAFIEFVRQHKNLYRIVNEAQFVAPEAYRDYYAAFSQAYQRRLDEAVGRGEIEPGNNEHRAWALIGANVFLGQHYGIWDDSVDLQEVTGNVGDLIVNGLSRKNTKKNDNKGDRE